MFLLSRDVSLTGKGYGTNYNTCYMVIWRIYSSTKIYQLEYNFHIFMFDVCYLCWRLLILINFYVRYLVVYFCGIEGYQSYEAMAKPREMLTANAYCLFNSLRTNLTCSSMLVNSGQCIACNGWTICSTQKGLNSDLLS